jgi:hypothetical protein
MAFKNNNTKIIHFVKLCALWRRRFPAPRTGDPLFCIIRGGCSRFDRNSLILTETGLIVAVLRLVWVLTKKIKRSKCGGTFAIFFVAEGDMRWKDSDRVWHLKTMAGFCFLG